MKTFRNETVCTETTDYQSFKFIHEKLRYGRFTEGVIKSLGRLSSITMSQNRKAAVTIQAVNMFLQLYFINSRKHQCLEPKLWLFFVFVFLLWLWIIFCFFLKSVLNSRKACQNSQWRCQKLCESSWTRKCFVQLRAGCPWTKTSKWRGNVLIWFSH